MKLSIIIPVLNEAQQIVYCLKRLQPLRHAGHEVIVVDGGSFDPTVTVAADFCDHLLHSSASRASQMNTGARKASGDYLLFLHADTLLPQDLSELFHISSDDSELWGRFDVQLSGNNVLFRIIEKCMTLRSRLTGIATGDQAIFINRTLFERLGGYPEIALMEDIAISNLLNTISKPVCLNLKVKTSSRRWEAHGIIKTIIKMWFIRLLYFFGYDTNRLARLYQKHDE